MKITKTLRNHNVVPENPQELIELRSGKWKIYNEDEIETITVNGNTFKIRSGLTFTPFANPTRCNAHCRFCSEELQRKHQKNLTSKLIINNYDEYFNGLADALKDISSLKNIGLSLSGLEATSEPMWLLRLLNLLNQETDIPIFNEKVLYTNASGLYKHPDLVLALKETGFDRLEISRCHYDEEKNQKIMYFNRNEPVYKNPAYEEVIQKALKYVFVKNSCILTQIGINSISEVETYLDWAMSLGVKQVVFREMSRLDNSYIDNKTKLWAENNRVEVEDLLKSIMTNLGEQRKHWDYQFSNAGYYYYNECFQYKNEVQVILESSSYNELLSRNKSDVIQKLVFHSNGNLCGDWNPDSHVIANYFN